ncbi:MAG: Holliday junction ATP-dependent DNA helicase RuvA [candidate division TM6 bacterium GW2011_GWF2_30_66]|jgi:Holliday junction DNA helicase RuvA|nr:MAG: Holliday junction ATP-dependent DNA helicase RuvA [candidate division TM6 bacterium GW2011_GWF2_30_66]
MLDYVKGSIRSINGDYVVVDIGNIGLKLGVASAEQFKVGQVIEFYSYMHWNQENGPSLFGFASELEKEVFLLVISCSGVGPKLGLAVLKDLGVGLFLDAIAQENEKILSKVSGIGGKKAEQIIVNLKHKVAKLLESGTIIEQLGGSGEMSKLHEVSDVLKSLNYSRPEISAAMNYLGKNCAGPDCSFDQLIRQALSFLATKGANVIQK